MPQRSKFFVDQLGSFVLSLLLATIVWVVAVNQQNPLRIGSFPDAGLTIEVTNIPENLVLVNKLEQREVLELRAPADSWQRLEVADVRAFVDLAGLGPGLHEVKVQVELADPQINILRQLPDRVAVRLDTVTEKVLPVHVEIIDPTSVPLGYVMQPPVSEPPTITVRGPRTQVEQIVRAEATVLISGSKSPVTEMRPITLRDGSGNIVDGPKSDPARVSIQVPIGQRTGYREVSVRASISGTVASGFWISNIAVQPQTVTVVGNPEIVAQLSGFIGTQPIDVSDAQKTISRQIGLVLPEGVTLLGEEGVSVEIQITPVSGGKTIQKEPVLQGIGPGLTAQTSPKLVDIILSGPLNALQDLNPDQVQVIVDLTERGPGTYQLRPTVSVPPPLQVQTIVPALIEVTIDVATSTRDVTVPLRIAGQSKLLESAISPKVVTVTVAGPVLELQSLITDTVIATLPLQGIGPGMHMVTPGISLSPTLSVDAIYPAQTEVVLGSIGNSQKIVVKPSWEGLGTDLLIRFTPSTVTITVKGPALSVRNLSPSDIRSILDVHGRGPGTYLLTPRVELPWGYRLAAITPPQLRVTLQKRSQ
ncbi:MAG: hypothetical protein GXP41_01620 [Chloroflexi bacterium]|nr:hypothetical protein [Chloroflexota bacterium]